MPTIPVNLVATGQPFPANWCVQYPPPESGNITVEAGQSETISWVLQDFPPTAEISAVTFELGQPGDAGQPAGIPWAGPEPIEPDWSTTDQNSLTSVDPAVTWAYSVTVKYKGQPYAHDPQIKNDPPTIGRQFS